MHRLSSAGRSALRQQQPRVSASSTAAAAAAAVVAPFHRHRSSRLPPPAATPQPQVSRQPKSVAPSTTTLEYEPEPAQQEASAKPTASATASTSTSSTTALAPGPNEAESALANPFSAAAAGPSLVDRLRSRYDRPLTLSRGPHQEIVLPTFLDGHRAITAFELKRDLQRWVKVFFAALAFATSVWAGFFGFCEKVGMAAPATLWEDAAGADDAAGWALENDDWTGGLSGGTSSALPLEARRMLHMAWFALFWPLGSTEADLQKQLAEAEREAALPPDERPLLSRLRAFFGSDPMLSGLVTEGQAQLALLPSTAIAEAYVRAAIEETLADRSSTVWLPPALKRDDLPLPPAALHRPRIDRPQDTVGIALLFRHASVLEQLATEDALGRAQTLFERVLRAVNGFKGAETLEVQLARRVGDLARVNGDPKTADAWLRWGIERVTGFQPPSDDAALAARQAPAASDPLRGWWSSLWSSPAHRPAVNLGDPTSDTTTSSVAGLLASKRPETLPPARLRALLSLVASLSASQSQPTTLPLARETQEAALAFIACALERLPVPPVEGASDKLHRLALERYRALLSTHLAEVLYVSPLPDAESQSAPARLLDAAFHTAAAISSALAPPAALPSGSADRSSSVLPFPPLVPAAAPAGTHPLPPSPTRLPFGSSSKTPSGVLVRPAADLLANARRTAAGAANLLAFLALRPPPEHNTSGSDGDDDGRLRQLGEASRLYTAAMTFVGPVPPSASAPDGPPPADEEPAVIVEEQSAEWQRYWLKRRSVDDRRRALERSTVESAALESAMAS